MQVDAVRPWCDVAVLAVFDDDDTLPAGEVDVELSEEGGGPVVRVYEGRRTGTRNRSQASTRERYRALGRKGFEILSHEWGMPDLCHVHVLPGSGILARELKRNYAIPYLVSEHWSGYLSADGSYARLSDKRLTADVVADASTVVTVSTALRDAMLRHGLGSRYAVVPNVVPRRAGVGPTPFVGNLNILSVARLCDREKNLSGLLRALALLPDEVRRRVHVDIVGGGSDHSLLTGLASTLRLHDIVEFHGERRNEEIGAFLSRAHALVCNSFFETFCVAVAEALVHGLPVIATSCGGPEDYIEQRSAVMVAPGDDRALADGIKYMLDNYPSLRRAAATFAHQRFQPEEIGASLADIYSTILQANSGSARSRSTRSASLMRFDERPHPRVHR
jgi:glycosyltransferase involved in cell wall biosynthesis